MMSSRRTWSWLDLAIVALAATALLLYARSFDFFCDDAFITLRYARNFATLGSPIYNVGERVEGYTSVAWMVLTAAIMRAGIVGPAAAQIVGAVSGVLLVGFTWALWKAVAPRAYPAHLRVGAIVLAALVASAPVAAWTLGGLETPLFAALVVASVWQTSRVCGGGSSGAWKGGALAGGILALTTFARPEGAALFGVAVCVVAWFALRRAVPWRALAALIAAYVLVIGPFVAWRWQYYGAPLPNTFYLKTSGDRGDMLHHGYRYLLLALNDFGEPMTQLLLLALLVPSAVVPGEPASSARTRQAALWMARGLALVLIPYVAYVGGDFLDLYRFLVPVLPLIAVAAGLATYRLIDRFAPGQPQHVAAFAVFALLFIPYVVRQSTTVNRRARALSEPKRAGIGVEPIAWTRRYALRWSATGRWIHEHAKPEDWMATGAAGAMPYFAEIRNLDRLGLCDAYVARNGETLSGRPGHQKEAPLAYTLSKRPAFLFIEDESSEERLAPKRDAKWEERGYVWVVVRLDEKYGAPRPFFHKFLMRTDRATQWMGEEGVQTALGMP